MRLATLFGALVLAVGCGSTATAQEADRIPLVFKCNVLAPGFVDNGQASTPVNCPGTNLPYTVPVDWDFCISTMYLMTKYPWNPPRYDDSLHSTYLEIPGMSVAAHHPEVHFVPSLPYKTSAPLELKISNGIAEAIYVYAVVGGYLIPEGTSCP